MEEKRGRGRPKKIQEADPIPCTVPSDEPETATAAPARVKKTPRKQADMQKMADKIQGLHQLAALFVGPEMTLDDDESMMMAEAVSQILDEYDMPVSPKTQAWIALASACAVVYVPRIPAALESLKMRKAKKINGNQATTG